MNGWQILDVQITLLSPLHLGTEAGLGNYETTNQIIPGAVLRGVVAEAILGGCHHPEYKTSHANCAHRADCLFWQIFGTEEPLWGFAYPARTGPAWPLPLTARTCKLYPGYDAGDGETYHGVYDVLVGQFVYDLLMDPCFPLRSELQPGLKDNLANVRPLLPITCPECGSALKRATGIYAWDTSSGPFYAGQLSVRRATHVGINRARGVAEDTLLFTQEAVEAETGGMAFHSCVVVPESKVGQLHPYLHERQYLIGQGRSRGNGHVKLSVSDRIVVPLAERLSMFRGAVTGMLGRASWGDERISPTFPGTLFSLTLHSPMILDRLGQPLAVLPPALLGLPEAVLVRAWARADVVGGWNQSARLPRRTCLAIQSGSVFLYWTPHSIEDAELSRTLSQIELAGIGEERPRGYGHVTVCDSFHCFNRIEERSEK